MLGVWPCHANKFKKSKVISLSECTSDQNRVSWYPLRMPLSREDQYDTCWPSDHETPPQRTSTQARTWARKMAQAPSQVANWNTFLRRWVWFASSAIRNAIFSTSHSEISSPKNLPGELEIKVDFDASGWEKVWAHSLIMSVSRKYHPHECKSPFQCL